MRAIAAQRERETPDDKGWSASVVPLKDELTANTRTMLLVLFGAVALLLIMAVTNVATLTASGMRRRGAELAIRRAIGATDERLFRQLFVQSALLAMLGTVTGLIVAVAGVRILVALLPPETPRLSAIRVDAPVLAIASAVAILATLLFGSAAARRGRASAAGEGLARPAEDTRGTARSGGGVLIAVEIALTLALGVMSVLMARSLAGLRHVDLGFTADEVAVARLALPATAYATDDLRRAFFDRLVDHVRGIPGVAAAGLISTRPLGGMGPATVVNDARVPTPRIPPPVVDVRCADGALFAALRIPIVGGRVFGPADGPASPPRVVVTRDLADRLWPTGDAVEQKLTIDMYGTLTADVIGVVGPVHLMDARTAARPAIFLSSARFPNSVWDLVVRTRIAPDAIVPALRAVVADMDPTLPLYAVRTVPALVDDTLATDAFTALMLAAFAAAALSLAAVGVFGVLAADVARRRKEIGVRLALGASGGRVISLMLGLALRRAAAGIAAGAAVALVASHAMRALLFGVTPDDPASIGLVTLLVLAVAIAATLIPVVRALRRAPLAALREN
jgi:predicted permease